MNKIKRILFTEVKNTHISFSSLKGIKDSIYFSAENGQTKNEDEDFSIQRRGDTIYVTQHEKFSKKRFIVVNINEAESLSFKFSDVDLKSIDNIQSLNISNKSRVNIEHIKQNILDLNIGGKSKLVVDKLECNDCFAESVNSTILLKDGYANNFDVALFNSDIVTEGFCVTKTLFSELNDNSFLSIASLSKEERNIKVDDSSKINFLTVNKEFIKESNKVNLKVRYKKTLDLLQKEEPIFFINNKNKNFHIDQMNKINEANRDKILVISKTQMYNLDRLLDYFTATTNKVCRF